MSSVTRGELLVNPSAMEDFFRKCDLNDNATSVNTLYSEAKCPHSKDGRELQRTLTQSIGSSPSSFRSMLMAANQNAREEDGEEFV